MNKNRRIMVLGGLLVAGQLCSSGVFAKEKKKKENRKISAASVQKDGGKTEIQSRTHKLVSIKTQNLDYSKVFFTSRGKRASLQSIIQKFEKQPAGNEILVAKTPRDFPGISDENVSRVLDLRENESIVIYGDNTMYGCNYHGYFCYDFN